MHVRKVQAQPVYGAPSGRYYCCLRLPRGPTTQYVAEYCDRRLMRAESADTLVIDGRGTPVHILDEQELCSFMFVHFWQVMFPVEFSAGMRGSDVRVTFGDDVIRLRFGRPLFDVEEQTNRARHGRMFRWPKPGASNPRHASGVASMHPTGRENTVEPDR